MKEMDCMERLERIEDLRNFLRALRREGRTIGLVPTMGFLHEGHMALVDKAKSENDIVVVSVFVNPLQFGPLEDLDKYPRDLEHDMALLEQHGCDVMFTPTVAEMYPRPLETYVELPELSRPLCGRTRPTHFRGVATVVTKLFHIVQPDKAYFGQKDGQQVVIIRRMVADLNFPVDIVTVSTVREPDGLAKSSRNVYLTPDQRAHATVLYRALCAARDRMEQGERSGSALSRLMADIVSAEPGVRLDYAEAVSLDTLQPMEHLAGPVMLAIAAYVGEARLIDNLQLQVGDAQVTDLV